MRRSGPRPERAFERDALTFPARDSAFHLVASAHSRTQGRNAQNTQDATIATDAPEPAKLWRESASATHSGWPATGAATCSTPLRAGAPAARRKPEFLAAGVTGRPAGSCPPTHGGQCLAALADRRSEGAAGTHAAGAAGAQGVAWMTRSGRRERQGCGTGAGGRPTTARPECR